MPYNFISYESKPIIWSQIFLLLLSFQCPLVFDDNDPIK